MDPLRAAANIGGIYALHKARDYVFICVVNYVQMFGCKLRRIHTSGMFCFIDKLDLKKYTGIGSEWS